MKITAKELRQIIKEEINNLSEKKDPRAEIRNRGVVVFPAESSKVLDDADHFPINNVAQARNALARASQYDKNPKWHKGSLASLVNKVQRKVKAEFPSIDTSPASAKPGKG